MLGDAVAGLVDVERGLAQCRAIGAVLDFPYLLALKAEAQDWAGRPEDGLETLEGALALSRRSDGFFYHAEILRLIGCLEAECDGDDRDGGAERALQAALQVSRRQAAGSLELRCAASLAQLMIGQGRSNEAAALLRSMNGVGAVGEGTRDGLRWSMLVAEVTQGLGWPPG